jgi:hypothetical protein
VNPSRHRLQENIADLETALRDELERYLVAVRPLLRALREAEERLDYLNWVDAERRRRDDA